MKTQHSIHILYDGNCPICCRKTEFLKRHDQQGKLLFSDIRAENFHTLKTGIPQHDLQKQIHAILRDGSIVSRMEVIRAAYREIGLGWIIAPTDWPLFRPLFDRLYDFVAKHRLSISRFF